MRLLILLVNRVIQVILDKNCCTHFLTCLKILVHFLASVHQLGPTLTSLQISDLCGLLRMLPIRMVTGEIVMFLVVFFTFLNFLDLVCLLSLWHFQCWISHFILFPAFDCCLNHTSICLLSQSELCIHLIVSLIFYSHCCLSAFFFFFFFHFVYYFFISSKMVMMLPIPNKG